MPQIQVLDQETINKIAAGEVIDRPASVVKELLENAIDAGASFITIEIKDGGISLIRITDNGCGMEKEQIPLAFLRHSTSKIKSIEDLATVSSLGFRGEALSSIAAVAQVELITKPALVLNGSRYQIEGSKEKSLEEIGAPEGTTFIVRNLFYNTPARRKFLKSPVTEAGYISDVIEKIALSHPEVSVRFINNGQNKLHTTGNGSLKDIIYNIYGREVTQALLPVNFSSSDVSLSGFIGKPAVSRGNRTYESYFINNRYIKSNLISKAIEDGCHGHLMQHKYPFTVLHIHINPLLLDVNVHPSKMELRFRNAEEIYQMVLQAVRQAFEQKELIPQVTVDSESRAAHSELHARPERPQKPERAPEPFEQKRIQAESFKPAVLQAGSEQVKPAAYVRTEPANVNPQVRLKPPDSDKPYVQPESAGRPKLQAEQSVRTVVMEEGMTYGAKQDKQTKAPEQLSLFDDKLLSREAKEKHRIIGQLFETYWLIEYQDKLFIIDQHAAHEKVLYERMYKSLKTRTYTSQQLSPPIIVSLSMQEEEYLKHNMQAFEKIGFEIEHFGGKEYSVRAVPDNLFSLAQKELFIDMLDSLADEVHVQNNDLVLERIASMSCKAAVKGNHRLSEKEADALITELLALDNPYNCPHGRPTIISMSRYELEKKFKRIV